MQAVSKGAGHGGTAARVHVQQVCPEPTVWVGPQEAGTRKIPWRVTHAAKEEKQDSSGKTILNYKIVCGSHRIKDLYIQIEL